MRFPTRPSLAVSVHPRVDRPSYSFAPVIHRLVPLTSACTLLGGHPHKTAHVEYTSLLCKVSAERARDNANALAQGVGHCF